SKGTMNPCKLNELYFIGGLSTQSSSSHGRSIEIMSYRNRRRWPDFNAGDQHDINHVERVVRPVSEQCSSIRRWQGKIMMHDADLPTFRQVDREGTKWLGLH